MDPGSNLGIFFLSFNFLSEMKVAKNVEIKFPMRAKPLVELHAIQIILQDIHATKCIQKNAAKIMPL